jgi:hypothetical protein
MSGLIFLGLATTARAADAPAAHPSICPGVNLFIEAPAPTPAQRTALFYPMSAAGNGPDQAAPMESEPHDDAADAFYAGVVGKTQGALWPRFADELLGCVNARGPFFSTNENRTNGAYSLEVLDWSVRRFVRLEASRALCPEPLRTQMAGTTGRCVRLTVRGK